MKYRARRRNRVREPQSRPQHFKISLFDYLASNVPSKVFNVINRNNDYRMPNSQQELTAQIKDFVKKNGESGIKDLSSIHPDKDLINSNCDCKKVDTTSKVDSNTMVLQKQDNYSDFSGKEFVEKIKAVNTNMIILGAFVLLGVAYIVKSNK